MTDELFHSLKAMSLVDTPLLGSFCNFLTIVCWASEQPEIDSDPINTGETQHGS